MYLTGFLPVKEGIRMKSKKLKEGRQLFPRMVRVKQKIECQEISDVRQAVISEVRKLDLDGMGLKGLTVGITAGSRGIYALPEIIKAIADVVKEAGANPVIIAAMGTHGGGTPEGQLEMLKSLKVTPETVGAPIRCCADTVQLGETDEGVPVFCNVEATKVDRLIIAHRIKPHTNFFGEIESGLHKMLTIGLGGPRGAKSTHGHMLVKGYEKTIVDVARVMLKKLPVIFAVGVVENWKGKTAEVKAVLPNEIYAKEKELQALAKENTVKLPFKQMDVLVLGEIGKNISGTGMDTKVVGRIMMRWGEEPKYPDIGRIVVLGLTPESHGNAIGIGLADMTTRKVFQSIDIKSTALNAIGSMAVEQGRIPCVLDNDREAIESALVTLGAMDTTKARLVYLKNTLQLEEMFVAESMLDEVAEDSRLEVLGTPEELIFDDDGNLLNLRLP